MQFISKNVEFSQEFEEDQEVAQKRKYYVDSQKKLKKIIKDIEKDDQITKIVKEDNIKNIDNILESQGIKTANIEVDKEPGNQSAKNLSYKPQNKTNLFGAPPNFDKKPAVQKKTTIQNNPPINASTKTNLFGNPQQQPSKTAIGKSTNIFGNPSTTTKKPEPTNNLFGNTTNTKKPDTAAKNNLFGNPNTKKPQTNNLFGTPNQTQNRNTNLFGNPTNQQPKQNQPQPQKQAPQQKNKDLNVSLKIDPKEGNITGVNVQGNIDPKDAYNFYQKNKQYMPSGQQMLSGAKTGMNMYNQANANNNNSNGLANLFGAPKK